jgi:hypothetical protein
MAVAAQAALAAPEHPISSASAKADTPPAAHRSASRGHPKTGRPAPHKTSHKDKREPTVRSLATAPARPADKSLDERPLLGPFSLGIETDPKVKPRSLRGGEYDPERDGDQSKGLRPSFFGLSLKSPLSW